MELITENIYWGGRFKVEYSFTLYLETEGKNFKRLKYVEKTTEFLFYKGFERHCVILKLEINRFVKCVFFCCFFNSSK